MNGRSWRRRVLVGLVFVVAAAVLVGSWRRLSEAVCQCGHSEADHEPRTPNSYDLCRATGCYCVEFRL
jgi:hypothetical protein